MLSGSVVQAFTIGYGKLIGRKREMALSALVPDYSSLLDKQLDQRALKTLAERDGE